jgi:exodeoxyribonuclease VII large subunit
MDSITVGALTRQLRDMLEGDPTLQNLVVEGEISNLTRHSSGHVYFTLKDEEAQIPCAMFKGVAIRYTQNMPRQGDRVLVGGNISLYPPQGRYQLIVQGMQKAGEGDLHRRFLELKNKLEGEGLFAPGRKRPLPKFPAVIGVVTSPTGAVIKDIANTLRRRYPHVKLLLSPAQVQGDRAHLSIIRALELLQYNHSVDVIILARGGGSLEDLWCFNEESLARTIAASIVPVISGVGHETDFTIADFVADVRASTPTAAAEMAVPDQLEVRRFLNECTAGLNRSLQHFIDFRRQLLDDLSTRLTSGMEDRLDTVRRELDDSLSAMRGAMEWKTSDLRHELESITRVMQNQVEKKQASVRHELDLLEARLQAFDLTETLKRGFTVTTLKGRRITTPADLKPGDVIETHFAAGSAASEVKIVKED